MSQGHRSISEKFDDERSTPTNFPRPLVDEITNEWRHKSKKSPSDNYNETTSSEADWIWEKPPRWTSSRWLAIFNPKRVPRRIQRYLIIYVLLSLVSWSTWKGVLRERYNERKELFWAFSPENKNVFGSNMMPDFEGIIKVKRLDSTLLPAVDEQIQRLIVVGDVHGCKDELVDLLEKVQFRKSSDHLVFTGDLISKGPDSVGVVRLARDLSASCVRGNHEDRMLLAHDAMVAEELGAAERIKQKKTHYDVEDESAGDEKARKLAKLFKKDEIEWLKQCPVVLDVGHISGMGDVRVVHAGLVAGTPLEHQDPFLSMNMRTIDVHTRLPSEEREGVCWTKLWNHYHNHVPRKQRSTVIYGHDSRRGLKIHKYSKGIDTGCVKGGELTALVITARPRGKDVTQKLVSVKCKQGQ